MEEFKKDIMIYLWSKGYEINISDTFINKNTVNISCCSDTTYSIFNCSKGIVNGLDDLYENDEHELNMYFLEFIGEFLRKYNYEVIFVNEECYESIDWKVDNIKHRK